MSPARPNKLKMAPRVIQDSIDLSFLDEDFPHVSDQTDLAINFEETEKLAESFTEYDNTKLMENNEMRVGLPIPSCAAMVQLQEEAAPVQSSGGAANAPKKRGQKQKYPESAATCRIRPRKVKVSEMVTLWYEKAEKKRRNASDAKRHRDVQKKERDALAHQLKVVTAERDSLLKLMQQLMQSEAQLRLRLASQVGHQDSMLGTSPLFRPSAPFSGAD